MIILKSHWKVRLLTSILLNHSRQLTFLYVNNIKVYKCYDIFKMNQERQPRFASSDKVHVSSAFVFCCPSFFHLFLCFQCCRGKNVVVDVWGYFCVFFWVCLTVQTCWRVRNPYWWFGRLGRRRIRVCLFLASSIFFINKSRFGSQADMSTYQTCHDHTLIPPESLLRASWEPPESPLRALLIGLKIGLYPLRASWELCWYG